MLIRVPIYPIVLQFREGRRSIVRCAMLFGTVAGLMLLLEIATITRFDSQSIVGVSVLGVLVIAMFSLAALARRSNTIRLWDDRLTYHHLVGTLSVPKNRIVRATYEVLTPRSSGVSAIFTWSMKKPNQPRLFLELTDSEKLCLDEFFTPPLSHTGSDVGGTRGRNKQILETIQSWLDS